MHHPIRALLTDARGTVPDLDHMVIDNRDRFWCVSIKINDEEAGNTNA